MMFKSDARSQYRALVLKGHKRFSNGWMLDASYTWSRSRDQDSNERSTSLSRHLPEDQCDLDADWGPSDFDARHNFVASATVELPWDFMVSAMVKVRSGFPYTALHDYDLNGDGYDNNERAVIEVEPGVYYHYSRNTERQPWSRTVNLGLSKVIRLGGEYTLEIIGQVFNLFDSANWWTSRAHRILSGGCHFDGDGEWVPCTTYDDFGETDIPGDPRHFQLGLRLRF
jgi:hypothetical protein